VACLSSFTPGSANSAGVFVQGVENLNQFLIFHLNLSPYAAAQGNGVYTQQVVYSLWNAKVDPTSKAVLLEQSLYSENITIAEEMERLRQHGVLLGVESKIASGDMFYWQVTFPASSPITSPSDFYLEVPPPGCLDGDGEAELHAVHHPAAAGFFPGGAADVYPVQLRDPEGAQAHGLHRAALHPRLCGHDAALQRPVLLHLGALAQPFHVAPSPRSSFLNALFIWNFFFAIFLLWAGFLLRIYYEEPDNETTEVKQPHRVIPFVVFYLSGLAFTVAFAIIQVEEHPIITPESIDRPGFTFILVMTAICLTLALFYVIYLFVLVKRKSTVAYRHNAFMNISVFFAVGVVVVIILGRLDVFIYSAALIMFTFTVTNFYSYLLQYLYSPTASQRQEF
jgi:hypothetical protein